MEFYLILLMTKKIKKAKLFNKKSINELKNEIKNEKFNRITLSFYKYTNIKDPKLFRDKLFIKLDSLNVLGRIYISLEGINAQISVPEHLYKKLKIILLSYDFIKTSDIKEAIQEGISFYKLTIKVRKELVAYGIQKDTYDMNKVGEHLNALDYNNAIDDKDSIIVDMRNYYESEIGKFNNAIIPNVETSKELLPEVKKILKGKEKKNILLYCTGGIRCEKASSYLIKNGFEKVKQLKGGIIQYAHEVKEKKINSKFIGKNFVFDNRLGERVTEDVISNCHICKTPCDSHTDCNNDACHILFIQCDSCREIYDGCCSKKCQSFNNLPLSEQKKYRKDPNRIVSKTFFDSRIKPKLNN